MADPLKSPARWSAYSYTFATGKRPQKCVDGNITWFEFLPSEDYEECEFDLPSEVFSRLQRGSLDEDGGVWVDYPTYFDAIAAANDAARRAIADGAWKPEAA